MGILRFGTRIQPRPNDVAHGTQPAIGITMNKEICGLVVTTPTDREIKMTRSFNAPRTLVFEALTKPELVQRWLLGPDGWSMIVCKIDLHVGGAYRYEWRHED